MGLLGVLENTECQDWSLEAIHFNLWALPVSPLSLDRIKRCRFLKDLNFYVDLGVRLKVNKELQSIQVHLPTFVDESTFNDLSHLILDERTNDLIFGTNVSVKNHSISYPGNSIGEPESVTELVVPIRSFSKAEPADLPLYKVEFNSSVDCTDKGPTQVYLRFRVSLGTASEIWHRKGWGYAKKGAIFDLRVSDVREGLPQGEQPSIAVRFKPIEKFFGFLIVPVTYHPGNFSPPLHYSRLLETKAWSPYLKGCEFDSTETLAIHQWRSDERVDYSQPFRIYMHLHREFGWAVLLIYLVGVSTISTIGVLANLFF